MSPGADRITGSPSGSPEASEEVLILPTLISPSEDATSCNEDALDKSKFPPSKDIESETLGRFCSSVIGTPARKIKAGYKVKVSISGSEPDRFSSGPVILISLPSMLPIASTFKATPVYSPNSTSPRAVIIGS